MELNQGFKHRPPQPTYNPVKGIHWLVKNWPEIEQYLMLGTVYELGTPEIENRHDSKQLEWVEENDPFIIKPPLGEASGSGSQDRLQTLQNKGKGIEEQPQTPNKQKKEKPLPQKKKVQISPDSDLSSSSSSSSSSNDESGPKSDKSKDADSEESGTETDRSVREITPQQKEWEKVTGIKQPASKIKEETIKKATRLAKIKEPEAFDSKGEKWKDTITFTKYMEQLVRWLKWQGLDVEKEEALARASFQFTSMATRWLKDYSEKTKPKKRNIHGFMVFLRKKIIPSTAIEELWKRYEGCHQAQIGQDSSINTFAQHLQDYQLRFRDNKGKALISHYTLQMKFVNGLSSLIKQQVTLAINWDISFEQIVNKAEQVQATMKQTHKPLQILNQNRKPNKKYSAGKLIEFIKSNYKFPCEKKKIVAPAAEAKGGRGGLNSNFPSARKRKDYMAHVLSFVEREKLKQEGKYYHCRQTGHMVSQCPQKKPMISGYQKINQQNRNRNLKVKTAALNMETQSALMQVMKGPTQR